MTPQFEEEPRTSPLIAHVVLWVLFLLLVVASTFSVLIPEIRDDSNEDAPSRPPAAQPPPSA